MEAFARVIYWKIKAANPDEDDNEDGDSTTTTAAAAATPSSSPPSSMFTSLFGKSKQKAKQNSFDLLQQQQKPVPRPPSQQQQQQQQQQASSSSSSSVTTTITTTGNSKPRLKIVFIGATATGAKTSFIHFYNRGEFLSNVCATAGAAFTMKETAVRGKDVIVEMWDIAGQERFFSVITMYLQNCDGVVIGYDIVSPWTYAIARKMCEIVSESFTTSKIMIIGNKVDLAETRSVTREQGQELAKTFCACAFYESKKIYIYIRIYMYIAVYVTVLCVHTHHLHLFFIASVKTGENVNESMDAFVDKILEGKGLL